ncbi:MAG: FKBP-type peptidyl-prolyl cis-trans isomerase [Gemmatimonadetes bacterium]|jgi:peptidylprolyl isomerase|nr:FKBP-type peptidyl-prolyl cis-trans isomerase [Gemmatimonadota bacterium]MBT7864003.1 FKBP-type peptidyl-prolyl cis-trans isomerase [Gemmatimonadota bacterium]
MGWLKDLLLGSSSSKSADTSGPTKIAEEDYETTSTGLQYHDLTTGSGPSPTKGQKVTVHYSGWLTNGKPFDSSRKKNKPFTFEIGRRKVIRGWDEGVMSMKVGGLRQLKVPAALGYGAVGSPPVIPRNATLIFEVELLGLD